MRRVETSTYMGNMSKFVVWMFITRSCQREISFLTLWKSKQTNKQTGHMQANWCVYWIRAVYIWLYVVFSQTPSMRCRHWHIYFIFRCYCCSYQYCITVYLYSVVGASVMYESGMTKLFPSQYLPRSVPTCKICVFTVDRSIQRFKA